MYRLTLIVFLLLCSSARAVNVPVLSETVPINAASPVAAQRLADGSASQCNSPQPGTGVAADVRYASVYLARLIEERPCLTINVSSAQCTLWSGGYVGFDGTKVSGNLVARSGTANSGVAYGVIAPFSSMSIVAGMTTSAANGCGTVKFEVTALQPWAVDRPGLSGKAEVGETLTAYHGKWTTPVTTTWQWQRCPPQQKCASIPGATGSTYAVTSEDADARLRVEEIATTNGAAQSSTAASLTTSAVVDPSPRGGYTATLSDDPDPFPASGQLLGNSDSAVNDAWTVTSPFPVNLAGMPTSSFEVDADGFIATRLPLAYAGAPVNGCMGADDFGPTSVLAPFWTDLATSGAAGDGVFMDVAGLVGSRTLTITWRSRLASSPATPVRFAVVFREGDGAITYRYDAVPGGGGAVSGDDGATIGAQYRPVAHSALSFACKAAAVQPGKRLVLEPGLPTISGTPAVGETLVAHPAALWGGPAATAFNWERCEPGGGCSYVSDKLSYEVVPADAGYRFQLLQTSVNAAGSTEIQGPATAVVPATPSPTPSPSPSPVPSPSPSPTPEPTVVVTPVPTVTPPADTTAPVISALRVVGRQLRVRTSEPATLLVRIARRGHATRALQLRTSAPLLTATRRLRLGHGRFRITVQATDAAGNRSLLARRTLRR